MCLPGGKRDPEDVDDVHCALREAQEELGIDPATVEIVAQMPPFLSKHKLSVSVCKCAPKVYFTIACYLTERYPAYGQILFVLDLWCFCFAGQRSCTLHI